MMKVVCISYYTPYKENRNGISALLYSILLYRPKDIIIKMYSYNMNHLSIDMISEVEKELNIQISILSMPRWYNWQLKSKILGDLCLLLKLKAYAYLRLPKSKVDEILAFKPKVIHLYMESIYSLSKNFPQVKCVLTPPDSIFLQQLRYSNSGNLDTTIRRFLYKLRYKQSLRTEIDFNRKNLIIHYVGLHDSDCYKRITNANNSVYISHPYREIREKEIRFSEKLKVLVAGANDMYMKVGTLNMIEALVSASSTLKEKVEMTFLGKNWEGPVEILKNSGYKVFALKWVDDYLDEILKYDIQLSPISYGTGTKGKVLDAMANGLYVIGSEYAMENICEDNIGGYMYRDVNEIPKLLLDIFNNKEKYEKQAEAGRDRARMEHNPQKSANDFYSLFK